MMSRKTVWAAGVGVLLAGLVVGDAVGQGGFVPGAGAGVGAGGVGGFNQPGMPGFNAGGVAAKPQATGGVNPFNALVNNPYGGPIAKMNSTNIEFPPPDYGAYTIGGDPYGGYLKGVAAVIDSQGRYLLSVEQAYMAREDLKRAKLATRRAAIEEWLWERENLPTLEQERERFRQQQVQRAANDPPPTEVWSGQSLNVLLQAAQTMPKTVQGPNIPLEEDVVSKINLNSGKAGINFGLLKNEGNLTWPLALLDVKPAAESQELRDQLQRRSKEAFEAAKKGQQVDPNTIREMEKAADRLQKLLIGQVGDLPFAQYSEGKRYLNQLNDGLKALREPNAKDFASGKFAIKANTVGDLIDYMSKNGLKFAPAVPGDEAAYTALHRALAAYGTAVSRLTAEQK
ncbi:MAG: hypothetical protein JNM56_06400 [Planctomycetia bacterium]|nr:hypothetical protein [Planctomycetia bacterium]